MMTWRAISLAFVLTISACQSGQPESIALERQIEETVLQFDGSSDFEAQVHLADPSIDLARIIADSMRGNQQALSHFFGLSQNHKLDGAASEGYAAWLGVVLNAAGDEKFGPQLAKESGSTQVRVRDYLCFDLGAPEHVSVDELHRSYPKTFPDR